MGLGSARALLHLAFPDIGNFIRLSPNPGFEKCVISPQPGDLEELSLLAHTVKGTIEFEMTGKKLDRTIVISIPNDMDCEIILNQREEIKLSAGSEIVKNGQKAYKLEASQKVKLHLKYL
jgi:hypothetical protein